MTNASLSDTISFEATSFKPVDGGPRFETPSRWHFALCRLVFARFLLLLALVAGTQQAQAGLRFCNKSNQTFDIAIGYVDRQQGWVAEGWWIVEGGQCKDAISSPLNNRYYYFYARSGNGMTFSGDAGFCTQPTKFRLFQAEFGKDTEADCAKAGLQFAKFRMFDTSGAKNHTIELGSSSGGASAAAEPRLAPASTGGGESVQQGRNQPAPSPPRTQFASPATTEGASRGTACRRYPNLC